MRSFVLTYSILVMMAAVAFGILGTTALASEVFRHEASRLNHLSASVSLRSSPSPAPLGGSSPSEAKASMINKNSRSARFVQPIGAGSTTASLNPAKILRLAVLAPSDPNHQFSLSKILPAITLAARTIESNGRSSSGSLLPAWRVQIVDRDSKCSSIHGPLEAFDLYNNKAIGFLLLL